jgi:hypothetical protein
MPAVRPATNGEGGHPKRRPFFGNRYGDGAMAFTRCSRTGVMGQLGHDAAVTNAVETYAFRLMLVLAS